MTAEVRQQRNTLRLVYKWRLLPDFWSTMDFPPRGISCYLVSGFTPPTAQFDLNNIISKKVFRVFVLQSLQENCHIATVTFSNCKKKVAIDKI